VIRGEVDEEGIPFVTLSMAGRDWRAIIDTGFNGFLELPYSLGSYVNPKYFGRGLSLLAGGQQVEEDQYLVDFPFDGDVIRGVATFVTGDELLIGTRLMRDHRLVINFSAGIVELRGADDE
jgi:predicted aspartyl protease